MQAFVTALVIVGLVIALVLRWIDAVLDGSRWKSDVLVVVGSVMGTLGSFVPPLAAPSSDYWVSGLLVIGGAMTYVTVLVWREARAARTTNDSARGLPVDKN